MDKGVANNKRECPPAATGTKIYFLRVVPFGPFGQKGECSSQNNDTSMGHTPSTAGTFRKKFRKKSGKTRETLWELFLEILLESTAGMARDL